MSDPTFEQRLHASRLRLSDHDAAIVAEMVAEMDRAAARMRAIPLGYADEPAVVFAAVP